MKKGSAGGRGAVKERLQSKEKIRTAKMVVNVSLQDATMTLSKPTMQFPDHGTAIRQMQTSKECARIIIAKRELKTSEEYEQWRKDHPDKK